MRLSTLLNARTTTGAGKVLEPALGIREFQAQNGAGTGSATVVIQGSNDPQALSTPSSATWNDLGTIQLTGGGATGGFSNADPWSYVRANITAISGGASVTSTVYTSAATSTASTSTSGGSGTLANGDRGDITVSNSGATWTLDPNVVTPAKMSDIPTASILGRSTAGTGDPEVLSVATTKILLSVQNVDNTPDANKPVSTAQQTALNAKIAAFNGAPSGGTDNDVGVRRDKPFVGTVYLRSGGVWGALDNAYTWATRPAASAATLGCIITITDWGGGVDFVCVTYDAGSTYRWVPVGRNLRMLQTNVPTAGHTGDTSQFTHASLTIPAGLVFPECQLRMAGAWEKTGTAGALTPLMDVGGQSISNFGSIGATHVSGYQQGFAMFTSDLTATRVPVASAGATGFYQSSTALMGTLTSNFANATVANWRLTNAAAGDTSWFASRTLEVMFP